MYFSLHLVFFCVSLVGSSTPSSPEDCLTSSGAGYKGDRKVSSTGLTCLVWTNISRDYDVRIHPDSEAGVGEHNSCRNPDASAGPWCYVRGPDGTAQRQACSVDPCTEEAGAAASGSAAAPPMGAATPPQTGGQEPARAGPQGEVAPVQPVVGISQRVRSAPKTKKKDLGTLGYVFAVLMMAVIIILGVGITLGYFYKRGRDIKKKHEQRVYEREMQRITLPLSAFSNPTCELMDETSIVVTVEPDAPPQEARDGGEPLIGQQAGTPGA